MVTEFRLDVGMQGKVQKEELDFCRAGRAPELTSQNEELRSRRTHEILDSEPRANAHRPTRAGGTFEPVQEEGQILQTVSAKSSRPATRERTLASA